MWDLLGDERLRRIEWMGYSKGMRFSGGELSIVYSFFNVGLISCD
jgi:hypothetical protein